MKQEQQLNITCGTDVVLRDTLMFEEQEFDPALSVDVEVNLVNSLGKRTSLEYTIEDALLIVEVPWEEGRLPGCYGLEVKGYCNGKKWSTYADALLRYTKATVEGATMVTVSSDAQDVTQVVGFVYSPSPIDDVEVNIDGGYGEPSADAEYEQRKLTIDLHNLRGEQGPAGPQGPQGESAVFDPQTGNISQMKQTTGSDALSPMSQKAITEEFDAVKINSWMSQPYQFVSKLTISGAESTYQAVTNSKYKVVYIPVSQGDYVRVIANNLEEYISLNVGEEIPAVGVSATRLYYKTYNSEDTSLDVILPMPMSGYLGVKMSVSDNVNMPEIYTAIKSQSLITDASNKLSIKKEIDITTISDISNSITSYNIWTDTSGGSARGKFVGILPGKNYVVAAKSRRAIVAILQSSGVSVGNSPDFADDFAGRILVNVGSDYAFTAPSDAHYVFLLTSDSIGNTGVEISEVNDVDVLVSQLSDDSKSATQLDLSGIDEEDLIVASDNLWRKPVSGGSKVIPVETGVTYIITTKLQTVVSVLQDGTRGIGITPSFSSSYPTRMIVPANGQMVLVIPSDSNYLAISTRVTAGDAGVVVYKAMAVDQSFWTCDVERERSTDRSRRVAESLGNPLTPLTIPTDENDVEVATTREVANVAKNAAQLTNIVWTPLADVPHNSGSGNFPANTPVQGLPYSSVKEIDKYIGFDVSLYTFMTALNNPYSLLYTENVREATQKSAWGKTYHGVNCGMYMGVVCSTFTGYSTGVKPYWATAEFDWCARYNLNFAKVYDQSAQGLRIGDLYWKDGHTRLILGLKRGTSGNVTHVKTAEAGLQYKTVENNWITASAFDTVLANEHGVIYRSLELYKNKYTPSEFVAVGDEVIEPYTYNDDICTFGGDKATFREGELVVINYNLKDTDDSWESIEVYKNGTLLETYDIDEIIQEELPESQRYHALKIGTELEPGQYKARVVRPQKMSDWTYWEVIGTSVSINKDGGLYKLSYDSLNGQPSQYAVCDIQGNLYAHDLLTDKDIANKSKKIDLVLFSDEQHKNLLIKGRYIKVYFKGEYGDVTNEPLLIEE